MTILLRRCHVGWLPEEFEARFWAKVDAEGDCWEWMAARTNLGYGSFSLGGKHHGHVLAGENLVLEADGRRRCRICLRVNKRAQKARLRAAREVFQ